MEFSDYWNETHKKYYTGKIIYDNWLDDYKQILSKIKTSVLDLGCGTGNDTLYLVERGFKVIACDYSETALDKIKKELNKVETRLVDISEKLPFGDNCFDLIIADLSLHYFDTKTTNNIMNEIKRILKPKGHLLARVNSIEDVNHEAEKGKLIEKNFYFVEGYNKRFFSNDDVKKFFSIIGKLKFKKADMLRYEKPKKVIEIDAEKD